jgi:hypothetical protein
MNGHGLAIPTNAREALNLYILGQNFWTKPEVGNDTSDKFNLFQTRYW